MAYDRKYLCPYCQRKIPKSKLVTHLGRIHADSLPKDFTPLQTAYHIINNRPLEYRRKCRICNAPTAWDENKGRYNFLCGNPACDKAWSDKMKATMGDKYGAYRPTATPEGLKMMLASRKISGTYKFRDGHEFTYTGSYELETLKFLDQVMEVKSEDLQVPGPVLNYEFQGKMHMYITDMYYIPYNLIIEIKDGGNNPNTNPSLVETRAKQMAKENWIIKKTEYNYLRLTDKDTSQLFNIFAELKLNLVENDLTRVIRVHEALLESAILDKDKPEQCPYCGSTRFGIFFFEVDRPVLLCKMCGKEIKDLSNDVYGLKENMYAAMQGFMPMNPQDTIIVNYMKKNVYSGENEEDYAVALDPKFDTIFARNELGILQKVDKRFLIDSVYTPYIIENSRDRVCEYIRKNIDTYQPYNALYESVFGHALYSSDQILFEESAKKYKDYYQVLSDTEDKIADAVFPGMKAGVPLEEAADITKRWYIKSDDGADNCCLKVKGYEHYMRGRSTLIPLKFEDGKWLAFAKEKKDYYGFPGGGWDKGENAQQAGERECREEVRINCKDVKYMNKLIEYHDTVQDWVKEHVKNPDDWWYGYYTMIFVGMYESDYKGKIAKLDQDPEMLSGEWYEVDFLYKHIEKEYADSIKKYISGRKEK